MTQSLNYLNTSSTGCMLTGAAVKTRVSDLLEVGSEAVHVLVVGQHSVSLRLEEVDVPDAQNSQQDGHVALQRSAAEVFVLQRETESKREISTQQLHNELFKKPRAATWFSTITLFNYC